ncbi:MAG TPA: redoxin domain-containing protein [Acidimicrobiales bacterium]|jgi:peroxiredoxin|nr:redoxin domain-containing protein [Acidimicrobiales bacterium]
MTGAVAAEAVVGEPAPDFALEGTAAGCERGRRTYTLEEFRGQPVVLVFYPGDKTPVCTQQLNTYTRGVGQFAEVGAQVLALNPADLDSHESFACEQGGFGFPLLSDPAKEVGARYGVLGPLGFYRRSVFVIDAGGVVTWAHRAISGLTFRPVDEIIHAVAEAAG